MKAIPLTVDIIAAVNAIAEKEVSKFSEDVVEYPPLDRRVHPDYEDNLQSLLPSRQPPRRYVEEVQSPPAPTEQTVSDEPMSMLSTSRRQVCCHRHDVLLKKMKAHQRQHR